jgi:hypothetical protein
MATEFENYPKGRVAVQGGELQDAYDVQVAFEDGETLVHTFRNKGMAAGSTGGKRKATITFKSAISQVGFERDYLGRWDNRQKTQARFKVPGKTITIVGRFTKPSISSNVDNFIEFSIAIEGKYSFTTS